MYYYSSSLPYLVCCPSHLQYFSHLLPELLHQSSKESLASTSKGKSMKSFACLKFFSSFPLLLDNIQNLKYITESCVI